MLQAHKLHDKIHDIDLSAMDAKGVGEVENYVIIIIFMITPFCMTLDFITRRAHFWHCLYFNTVCLLA